MKLDRTPVLAGIAFLGAVVCLLVIVAFYAYGEAQTARGSKADVVFDILLIGVVNLSLICIPPVLFGLLAGIGIRRNSDWWFVPSAMAATVAFLIIPAWTFFLCLLGMLLNPPMFG